MIIPVYNTATYLERCIDSLACQTYRDMEIILVDDGSTDGSGEICDSWIHKDSRFRVIHQANSGVSVARNAGLKVFTGEYLSFVDSDDWLERKTYELAINKMKETDSNLFMYKVHYVDEVTGAVTVQRIMRTDYQGDSHEAMLQTMALDYLYKGYPHNKVWKVRSSDNWLRNFDTSVRLAEDLLWNLQMIASMPEVKCYFSSFCGYNYLQRHGSATKDGNLATVLELFDTLNMVVELSKTQSKKLLECAKVAYHYRAISLLGTGYNTGNQNLVEAVKPYFIKYNRSFLYSDFSLKSWKLKHIVRSVMLYINISAKWTHKIYLALRG